ncbi:hypothetical protein [Helicobacter bilis]|jgi:hypothetical protein|nr:hypothetical protein [Helicobacter bilis]
MDNIMLILVALFMIAQNVLYFLLKKDLQNQIKELEKKIKD